MRDDDADGTAIECAPDPGRRILRHSDDRSDSRVERRDENLASNLETGGAVLQVNEEPMESATRGNAGDSRRARMRDDQAGRDAAGGKLRPQWIDTHRLLPPIYFLND